jgi:hypothetical protein
MTYPYVHEILYIHLIKYFYPDIDMDFFIEDDQIYIDIYITNKEELK